MPRRYMKKRGTKRRAPLRRRRLARIPRRIGNPQVVNFKRSRYEIIQVGTSGSGWVLDGTATTFSKVFDFQLNDLYDNSDFVNLFKFYKINAVAVKLWPAITTTAANPTQVFNNQLMLRYDENLSGTTTGSGNIDNYIQSQTAKVRRIISGQGNPIKIYMKVKQSNMIFEGVQPVGTTAYSLQRPKWVATDEPQASHYGMNMCIHRTDGTGFAIGNNQTKLRIEYTYYLSCKKVG